MPKHIRPKGNMFFLYMFVIHLPCSYSEKVGLYSMIDSCRSLLIIYLTSSLFYDFDSDIFSILGYHLFTGAGASSQVFFS